MRYRRKVSSYSSSRCFPMDVTIMPAPCLPASSMSNRLIIALLSLSRWLMGSSRKIKSNGWQRLRIKATRCCCPKESLPALSSVLSGMSVASKRARISFFFLWLVRRFFNKTFSRAVSSGTKLIGLIIVSVKPIATLIAPLRRCIVFGKFIIL